MVKKYARKVPTTAQRRVVGEKKGEAKPKKVNEGAKNRWEIEPQEVSGKDDKGSGASKRKSKRFFQISQNPNAQMPDPKPIGSIEKAAVEKEAHDLFAKIKKPSLTTLRSQPIGSSTSKLKVQVKPSQSNSEEVVF